MFETIKELLFKIRIHFRNCGNCCYENYCTNRGIICRKNEEGKLVHWKTARRLKNDWVLNEIMKEV